MSYTVGTKLYLPNINLSALVEEWEIDNIAGDPFNANISLHRTSDNLKLEITTSDLGKFQSKQLAIAIAKEQLAEKEDKE